MKIDNIFWIIIDSVRSYPGEGDWRYRLKIMDELHDFYNFTNAYTAAPSTIMSAASMFTGNNTYKIARNYNDWKLDDKDIIPLSQILHANGFEILPIDNSKRAREMLQDVIGTLKYKYFCKGVSHNSNWTNKTVLDQFKNVLKKSQSEKKYVMTWFDCRGDILINKYVTDTINEIKKYNLYHNSIIIINSDHGYPDPKAIKFKNIKKFRHDLMVTEDNIKVPLLIKIPGYEKNNINIDTEVSLIDIYPTILDSLNIKNNYSFDGESLLKLFNTTNYSSKNKSINNRYLRSDTRLLLQDGKITTLIKDRMKFTYYNDTGFQELYNLSDDPNELKNLANYSNNQEDLKKFKTYLNDQNSFYEKKQEIQLQNNLKKSLDNLKAPERIYILCNLNNYYLKLINHSINKIFHFKYSINFFSTKKNENNTIATNIKLLKNLKINKNDLLIIIDEKNYYRILDFTFYNIAKKIKAKKIFLDLNFNKNNLFFSKWIFPLLKYKNNFYFYKNEPTLFLLDIIKILKLSFKQYYLKESIETPRMEDIKLHRDRVLNAKQELNKKINFYDFILYLRNINTWGGTQTQFWQLIDHLIILNYNILVLFQVNSGGTSNKFTIDKYQKIKNITFQKVKNTSLTYEEINALKYLSSFIPEFFKRIFKFRLIKKILKFRLINMLYRVFKTKNSLGILFRRSKIIAPFLTENNLVCLVIYRFSAKKTGQLYLNERNDFTKQSSFLTKFIYKFFLSKEVCIITNSLNTFNYFSKFHKNIHLIYNYTTYDPKQLNFDKKDNFISESKKIKIINIGRFVKQKNQIDLIKKFKKLEKKDLIKLDIIGRGVLYEKIRDEIIRQNLKNISIKNTDYLKVSYSLKNYDAVIINSLYEGQSNLILEAINSKVIILINEILKNELLNLYKNTNFEKLIYFYNSNNFQNILEKIIEQKDEIKKQLIKEKRVFIEDYQKFKKLDTFFKERLHKVK